MTTLSYRSCRPRESGDPYAVSLRCGTDDEISRVWWFWGPAFAGTTAESQCLARDLATPLAHGGEHHHYEDDDGGNDEGEADRLAHEYCGVASGHQHRAAQVLLHHRPEHEAEQHGGERKAEPHADEADDAERRGQIDLERGVVHAVDADRRERHDGG